MDGAAGTLAGHFNRALMIGAALAFTALLVRGIVSLHEPTEATGALQAGRPSTTDTPASPDPADVLGARVVMISTVDGGYVVTDDWRRLAIGQVLDDGYELVEVSAAALVVRRGGRTFSLPLPSSDAAPGPLRRTPNDVPPNPVSGERDR